MELARMFSKPWPGLANTNTRRSAFSIGVNSPACNSNGRMSWNSQQVACVRGRGVSGGITSRRLGHNGTKFFCSNALTYSFGKSAKVANCSISSPHKPLLSKCNFKFDVHQLFLKCTLTSINPCFHSPNAIRSINQINNLNCHV